MQSRVSSKISRVTLQSIMMNDFNWHSSDLGDLDVVLRGRLTQPR